MLLILLGMSVNAAWGLDIDQAKIYLASLKAQKSPESTGSGEVKLTWLDMMGDEMNDELAIYLNPVALPNQSWISQGSTAQLVGGTLFAMDGIEMPMGEGHMFMTSFVYFLAEGLPANGSYFSHWTFTDPAISRIDTAMGNGDNIPFKSPCYKVLPDTANNGMFYKETGGDEKFGVSKTNVVENPNNIYAVFKKYLLSNPVATSASMEAVGNAHAELAVIVEVNGDAASLDAADFGTFAFSNNDGNDWAYDLEAALASKEVVSAQKTRITIPVTYTYKNGGYGLKNTTMTISMAGASPSALNINLSVNALDPARPEAFLLEGKEDASPISGTLSEILGTDIRGYSDPIIKLNKPVDDDLTFAGKNFTLDLNGNETQAITVSSGNVTFSYSKFGGKATSLAVNGGKAILNGGTFGSLTIGANGAVEQNGATITGAATNAGSLTTTEGAFNDGLTSSKTLVLNGGTFKGETAVTVSGGTAAINRGTIEGAACGLKVTGGEATTKKLAAIKGGTYSAQQTGGTLIVESGKFDGALDGTINFTSGYFKTNNNYGIDTEGLTEMLVSTGVEYNEGYRYFLGTAESAVANGAGVCRIGNVSYAKLEDAIAYANNNPSVQNIVIFMTNNYTLPAGYYTLPANATIVVPMSDSQEKEVNMTAPRVVFNDERTATPYVSIQPTEFRRLTFASGVNMDVFGHIELTCSQYASNEAYTAQPCGAYGHLVLDEGSHLTLQSGSEVRAWGFVTGKGEMDARRGATVREMFQLGDWKGAFTSVGITGMAPDIVDDHSDKKIFPVTQYFIQNIESPVKYHPGAVLSTSAAVSEGLMGMSISMAATDIAIVGVSGQHQAIFLMDQMADAENTWVRKWYDAENDIQVYDINSAAHIGSMVLDMGDVNLLQSGTIPIRLNSAKFDLPLTCNFKIHLLSGLMDFQQNTSLLPGAEVEVDKEATVTVAMDPDDTEHTGALYVYDAEDWDKYAYCNEYDGLNFQQNTAYTKTVRYAPSWNGRPTKRDEQICPPDAAINVHGSFMTATGFVYCSEHGANIFSNNKDAGTFIFNESAEDAGERTVNNVKGSGTFEERTFFPAKLKNSDGTYTETTNAFAQTAFVYRDGAWQSPINEDLGTATFNMGCYTAEISLAALQEVIEDEENQLKIAVYHAPDSIAEYLLAMVTAASLPEEQGGPIDLSVEQFEYVKAHQNEDHTEDTQENQAMFDLYETVPTQVKAIKNAGYDLGPTVQKLLIKPQEWVEIAGTAHAKLDMFDVYDFKAMYDQGVLDGNYDLCNQAVNAYLLYFQAQSARPYIKSVEGNADHTFSDADGAGRLFILLDNCQWWEVEKKDNLYHCIHPNNDTYYYWHEEETIKPDPDDEETWVTIPGYWEEKRFTITWKNWDGTEIISYDYTDPNNPFEISYDVTYGTMAEFLGTNPTREATIDYTYDFAGWSPALGKVTSDVTYTATFTQKPRMYTIIFQNEGGVEIERQFLTHNEVPVCENTPTKVGHTLVWEPAIAAVTGDATYRATWLENPPTKYEITFFDYNGTTVLQQGNVAVGALPTPPADPAGKPATSEYTYVFDHWVPALEEVSATSPKSYTAVYREEAVTYTVTFLNEDDSEIEHHEYAYGETPVCSATPTKPATAQYSYTFAWDPQIETVREDKTYKASFTQVTNRYTVTLKANPSGACTFSGAGTFDYGTAIAIAKVDNEGYTFSNWTDGKTGAEVSELPTTITGDINLVANFTVDAPDWTITWKSEDGNTTLAEVGQKANTATIYTGAIPTKPATAQSTFTFDGWTTEPNGAGTFYKNNMTPKATANATYYAHFAAKEVIMEVGLGQAQNIAEETTVNQLVLHSNGTVSGQLTGDLNDLNVTGVCYYDLTGTFTAGKWYAVAVPWQVTASDIRANGNALSLMSGDYLAYYDGSVRAAQGKVDACWKYLSNGDVLVPGSLYMLYLQNDASVLRFPKKSGTPILTSETNVSTYGSDEPTNANWNGIANPAIFYAYLSNTGATVGQVFNAAAQSYEPVALSTKLIVAKPIFVQATNNGTASAVTTPPAPAPVRQNAAAEAPKAEYQVEIASYGRMQDRLFIHTNEDKEADTYTLGQDVVKFGVSNTVAQMWVDRYDAKLCMNTMTPVNNVAEFPLGIYAPRTGEYQISNVQSQMSNEAYTLYLTYNGEAIWNLSESDYVLHLEKGTAANYGLRVSAKAPQVATGIDEALVDAQGETKKVLINNQVFIIRGEKVYTIDGQLVK